MLFLYKHVKQNKKQTTESIRVKRIFRYTQFSIFFSFQILLSSFCWGFLFCFHSTKIIFIVKLFNYARRKILRIFRSLSVLFFARFFFFIYFIIFHLIWGFYTTRTHDITSMTFYLRMIQHNMEYFLQQKHKALKIKCCRSKNSFFSFFFCLLVLILFL